VFVHPRHGLDGHGVGDHILENIADGREQGGEDEPGFDRHHRAHAQRLGHQPEHDQQTGGDQAGTEPDQPCLVSPDQIDQMSERHLQRPRDSGPETERCEEGGGEAEVFLDEEGADDAGQPGNSCRHIDHQRRQVGEPHLTAEFDEIVNKPVTNGGQHGSAPSGSEARTAGPTAPPFPRAR